MLKPISNEYQIMDRIHFIKKMLTSHQNKLISEPQTKKKKFKPAQNNSFHIQTQQLAKGRSTDNHNRTFSMSEYSTLNKTNSSIQKLRTEEQSSSFLSNQMMTASKKLLRQEIKVVRSLLDKRNFETNELSEQNIQKDKKIIELSEMLEARTYEVKKLLRERDDLKEEVFYTKKKVKFLEEDISRFQKMEQDMKRDLDEAREAIIQIKQYELELNMKEKKVFIQ